MPRQKKIQFIPTPETWEAAMSCKGLVTARAAVAFRKLPPHWQQRVDFADFVADGVYFLAKRLTKWDKSKGALTTLAYTTIERFYNSQLTTMMCPKRGAELVSVEEVLTGLEKVGDEILSSVVTAERSVQRLHKDASFPLLTLLDDAFFHPTPDLKVRTKSEAFKRLRQEFRQLATRHGVTIDDYRTVVALHHARIASIPLHISF